MLRKLLRYDLQAVFRVFRFVLIGVAVLSLIAGFATNTVEDGGYYGASYVISELITGLFVCSVMVEAVFPPVLLAVNFAKKLCSDQAYLTYLLPVKRSDLINSKCIAWMLMTAVANVAMALDILLMTLVSHDGIKTLKGFFSAFGKNLSENTGWTILYVLEGLILLIVLDALIGAALYALVNLFRANRKAAIVTVIVSGVAFELVISILTILAVFGVIGFISYIEAMEPAAVNTWVALILFQCIAAFTAFAAWLYFGLRRGIEQKLNLS